MSLIVEDGTGLSTAESYISVADAGTYHSNRGNAAWAALASDTVREQCLRKATDYMVGTYRDRWQGLRTDADVQALCWPRYGVVIEGVSIDDNVIPEPVKRACCELALKAATAELSPDLTQGVLSEQVGSIAVTYDKSSPQNVRYKAVDAILAPYLASGGGGCSMKLVRT
ncbi:MAG: DnaT-like ssDNA-binding protein [Phycisphaerae bacterium]|jgi:hypothetical protein